MKKTLIFLIFGTFVTPLFSQTFEADLQLRPRFEYRNGFKSLLLEEQDAASFVSQRSRITLSYKSERLFAKLSLQNVNVWGDVATMRLEESNEITFFEVYGQYQPSKDLFFRLGRQVLSYDNQRILGEVNWAQQGQSHDAALMSWLPETNQRLDIAVAYNAPAETLIDVPYTINSYKNLQFAWYHIALEKVGFSFLAMNTGYEFGELEDRKVSYIQTFGAFHKFSSGNFSGNVAAYGQTGEKMERNLSAWYAGLNINYSLADVWKIGAGGEYFSGTDMNSSSDDLHSFTPLFGTNHGFNGLMDYFFVGNHQNSVGLLDLYAKLGYSDSKFELAVTPHIFASTAEVVDSNNQVQDDYLGTEIDLTGSYKVQKDLSFAFGYSQMFGTRSLEILKGGNSKITQNWAWLMVNFSPQLFSFSK